MSSIEQRNTNDNAEFQAGDRSAGNSNLSFANIVSDNSSFANLQQGASSAEAHLPNLTLVNDQAGSGQMASGNMPQGLQTLQRDTANAFSNIIQDMSNLANVWEALDAGTLGNSISGGIPGSSGSASGQTGMEGVGQPGSFGGQYNEEAAFANVQRFIDQFAGNGDSPITQNIPASQNPGDGTGMTTPPAGGDNSGTGTTTPPAGGDNSGMGTTAPPAGGDNSGMGMTTPPAGGDNSGMATTTPPAGGDNSGMATTTPPAGGDNSGMGTTAPPAGGDNSGMGTTSPPAGGDNSGMATTTPPAGGDNSGMGTTTPPSGGDNSGTGTTAPPAGGDNSGTGTTAPPAGGDNSGTGTTAPPAGRDNSGTGTTTPPAGGDNSGMGTTAPPAGTTGPDVNAVQGTGGPAAQNPGQWTQETYDGMNYEVMLPQNYNPSQQYSVVMYEHQLGLGGDWNDGQNNGTDIQSEITPWINTLDQQAQAAGQNQPIVVVPLLDQSSDPSGGSINFGGITPGDNPGQLQAMSVLQNVTHEYSVNPSQIYAFGASMGAQGIEQQMIDYNAESGTEGKVFAGAITFAGGIEASGQVPTASDVAAMQDAHLWSVHGTNDNQVPIAWDQNMAADMQNNPNYQLTQVQGAGHDVWDDPTTGPQNPQYFNWLLQQQAPNPTTFQIQWPSNLGPNTGG